MAASFILCIFRFFRLLLSGHQAVAIENAAFRLQLAVFRRQRKRPVFTVVDRMFSDRSLSAVSVGRQRPLAGKDGAGPSSVPYCHVVFTLPSQLIPLAYQNARLIYNLLFQAASEALLTIAGDPMRMGARVGFLAVLHTWNQKLGLHPHLHCLVPAGGCPRIGSVDPQQQTVLPASRVLGSRFRNQFLKLLGGGMAERKTAVDRPSRISGRPRHLAGCSRN